MNRLKISLGFFGFLTMLLVTLPTKAASAAGLGDIFADINHMFNGLFQGGLPLILFLFVIVLVLGLFSAPLWLKKVYGWSK